MKKTKPRTSIGLADLDKILEHGAAVTFDQQLQSPRVEGAGFRVYPPTFPFTNAYFIDALPEGHNRCILDTKQSQARTLARKLIAADNLQPSNRFLPFVTIRGGAAVRRVGECGHRVADAAVLLSEIVGPCARSAMEDYNRGDSTALGTYFPESLIFGFWDSHSLPQCKATQVSRSRVIQSEIHGYDVSVVHSTAVYQAAAPRMVLGADYDAEKKDEKLSKAGLANAISDDSRDGVIAKSITRTIEINIAALRQICCQDKDQTRLLQVYLFYLAILSVAFKQTDELNLRSATALVPLPGKAKWPVLMRDGKRFDLQIPDALLAAARRQSKAWFAAVTDSGHPPVLHGVISTGAIAKVRKSLNNRSDPAANAINSQI